MKLLSLFLAIIILFVPIQAQNKLSTKNIEAIKQIEETYRTAWLKNDETTILSLFAENGTLFPNEIHWSMEKRDKSELKRYLNNSYFMGIYVKQNKQWKILKRIWSGKTQEVK